MRCNRVSENSSGRIASRRLPAGRLGGWALSLAVVLLGAAALRADDPDTGTGPAARAVRLSSVDGQVQLSQGGQVLADQAVANTPLFEGSRVVTSDDGRAEIQFEDGSMVRISPNSAVTLTVLHGVGPSAEAQITLEGGLAYFELQGNSQNGAMSVKFGDSVAVASGFTVMRIDMDSAPGELAVFSGNAHLDRGTAASVDVHGGESLALSATDASRYTLSETIAPNSWDAWNSDRDQALNAEAASATGASKDYGQSSNPAWNDLDANGNWYNVPGQGNIWSPYDASNPGWDPYGNGYWMDTSGYGYTWVSGNSWGYLPYSCGTWTWYDSFGWGWAPGMGGCSPWWGGGGGYIGVNVGTVYGGYRKPMPPRRPRGPRPLLIAVNRHSMAPVGSLPARDKTSVVDIAGYTTQPLRPVSPRPVYSNGGYGYANRGGASSVGGMPAAGQARSGFVQGSRAGAAPVGRTPTAPRGPSPGSSRGGYSAPSAPASHASGGGGGGGGAAHASGGGGAHH
jgi:hypothetical protein